MSDKPFRVLLIEDHRQYAAMLRTILSQTNAAQFSLTCTEDLHTSLEALKSDSFDIILLDLSLPDSQGYNTFCEVHNQAPHIPIVVITASDDKALALQAVREGAQDYIVKGDMDARQFIRSIQYAVERHRTVENLRQRVLIDELTGLLNRGGFMTLAKQHIKIAQRANQSLTLFFADLDGLKEINDQFGHLEGDRALQQTAQILKETFRSSDVIARLGGDEFTILAIDAPPSHTHSIFARLQEAIDKRNQRDCGYKIEVSVGVAYFDPHETGDDIVTMLAAADKALYEQKRQKKNQTTQR